uniref:Cytochrome p450 cyp2 subfamily protein n=1 Tax=Rhipicephalus zambeziensis TaxID=60191 RepID=A0A224YWL5_9ACAR
MMTLEWQTILLTFIITALLWMVSRWCRRIPVPPPGAQIPPMPPPSSVIGHLELLDLCLHKKALSWAKQYGPVFRLQLLSREVVIVNDLENLKAFSKAKELLNRPEEMNRSQEFYKGLLTLNGQVWSANRRFCMTMLRDLGFAKCKTEEKMMRESYILKKNIDEANGEPVAMGRYIPECITCNIATFFHGGCIPNNASVRYEFNSLLNRFLKIFGVADILVFTPKFIQRLLGHLPFTSISKGHALSQELDKFIIKEILTKPPVNAEETKRDFVQRYIKKVEESKEETDSKFQYRHLVGHLKAFIGAGTVGANASVLFHLANFAANPDSLQCRVQQEIDEVLGADREPTWEDRKRMPFTFACMMETERCKTSLPLGLPRLAAKDVVVNNFFIAKGTVVLFNLWGIGNDPLYWKEPERFDPSRYLAEDGSFMPESTRRIVPFSIGSRSCPGETFALMEIFLLIVFLLQKYRVVHHEPFQLDLRSEGVCTSDLEHVKLRFIPRHTASDVPNTFS